MDILHCFICKRSAWLHVARLILRNLSYFLIIWSIGYYLQNTMGSQKRSNQSCKGYYYWMQSHFIYMLANNLFVDTCTSFKKFDVLCINLNSCEKVFH